MHGYTHWQPDISKLYDLWWRRSSTWWKTTLHREGSLHNWHLCGLLLVISCPRALQKSLGGTTKRSSRGPVLIGPRYCSICRPGHDVLPCGACVSVHYNQIFSHPATDLSIICRTLFELPQITCLRHTFTHVLLAATRVDVDFIITAFSSRRASVSAIYLSSGRTSASHFHRRRSLFWSVNEQCVEFSETLGFKKKWSHVRYFSWSRGDINLPQVLGVSACSSSGIAGRLFAGGWPRHCCFCGVWSSVHELNGFFLFNTKWGGKDN